MKASHTLALKLDGKSPDQMSLSDLKDLQVKGGVAKKNPIKLTKLLEDKSFDLSSKFSNIII